MKTILASAAMAGLALVLGGQPASAQRLLDELKIGVLAHDVTFGGRHLESGRDVNLEALFVSPDLLQAIWAPRPHIGASFNTDGNTDDLYFGLTWTFAPLRYVAPASISDKVFINFSLGGAYQDGFVDRAPAGRKRLGSPVLFRESLELGYQVDPIVSFSGFVDHISNANLGNHNAGITSAGGRMGFRF